MIMETTETIEGAEVEQLEDTAPSGVTTIIDEEDLTQTADDVLAEVSSWLKGYATSVAGVNIEMLPIGELSTMWFNLKEKVDKLEGVRKSIKNAQESIEVQLIKKMDSEGMDSFKNKSGTISYSVKPYPSVNDVEAFIRWVAEDIDERLGFVPKRVNTEAVKQMLEEQGMLPPGVDTFMKESLSKRKK